MDRMEVARRFAESVVSKFSPHISKIILFGSVADESDGAGSDIDLVVLSDDKSITQGIYSVVGDYILEYQELPLPIVYTTEEFESKKHYSFQKEVLEKGLVLYGG